MPPDRAAHTRDGLRLLALLALAAVLRLWALDQVPRGFYFDESAVVVEARCLRETGHDLRGNAWPFFARALDDWKDPLLVWGTALTGPLLGDDVAGARRWLALVGVGAVAATWWLGRELFGACSRAPLLAAGLLALSPWHLQFSRIAWQAGTLVLVQTLALAALLRADRLSRTGARAPLAFALGGALWGLVLWTYSPAKLWVPLLGAVFLGLTLARDRRWPWSGAATAAALLGFALTAGPFLAAYLGHREAIDLRLRELSLLGGPRPVEAVLRGYLSHLSFKFLVLEGDSNQRHSPPGVGQLLWVELPLLLVGLWSLWARARGDPRAGGAPLDALRARLLLAWLLLAPALGAFTAGAPHATRTIAALPAVQLVAAAGALALLRAAASRRGASLVLQLCVTASALLAVRAVLVTAPRKTDPGWWRPELRRVVDRAVELAAGAPSPAGGPAIVFLPETGVTWSDWLYLQDVPPSVLQAHAAETRGDELVYDPFDRDGKFWFAGAAFPTPGGRPAPIAPGAVIVEGPGDKPPPRGSRLLAADTSARYWRAP